MHTQVLFWGLRCWPAAASCSLFGFFTVNKNAHTRTHAHTIQAIVYEEEEGLKSMTDDSGERGSLCLLTPINYQSVRPPQFVCVCVVWGVWVWHIGWPLLRLGGRQLESLWLLSWLVTDVTLLHIHTCTRACDPCGEGVIVSSQQQMCLCVDESWASVKVSKSRR